MKNRRLTSILVACALTIGSLASISSASAQTAMATVNIPFAFQTETQTLPAGTYSIDRESSHLILLRGPDQKSSFVPMHDAVRTKAPDHGSLVFDRSGDKYFLRQIWTPGTSEGLECSKESRESSPSGTKQTSCHHG